METNWNNWNYKCTCQKAFGLQIQTNGKIRTNGRMGNPNERVYLCSKKDTKKDFDKSFDKPMVYVQ